MTHAEETQLAWTRGNMATTFDRIKDLLNVQAMDQAGTLRDDMRRLDLGSLPGLIQTYRSHGRILEEDAAAVPCRFKGRGCARGLGVSSWGVNLSEGRL